MYFIGAVRALSDIQIRCAAVAQTPGKSLRNYEHRENNARCGVAESAQLAVAYKNLVDYIIKCAYQQR